MVDAKNLPKPYGGELDWKYEDDPALDDATRALIGEMPKGPAVFLDGKVVQPPPPLHPSMNGVAEGHTEPASS